MKLILTRHGKTVENENGIMMGQGGGRLSDFGKKQVEKLGKELKNERIDVILSSNLKRCKETTKAIARFHPDAVLIYSPILRERDMGIYTMVKKEKIPGGAYAKERFEGGESLKDVRERCEKFFDDLVGKYRDKTVLVVTHGIVLRLLVGYILGKDIKESVELGRFPNASITEIEIDGKVKIVRWKQEMK